MKKYNSQLVKTMQEKEYDSYIDGIPAVIKEIPDDNRLGAMDPRLYKKMKKLVKLLNLMPNKVVDFNRSKNSIRKTRKMFNHVMSKPIIQSEIKETLYHIPTDDGSDITLFCFKKAKTPPNTPILYYMHGGGFFAGSTAIVADALKYLVEQTGIIVCSIDYRLAPEHPYPIGHEDCYTGLKWVQNHANIIGGNSENIFTGGDSAGGNLAIYCINRLIEENNQFVKGQLLLYPTVNMGDIKDPYTRVSQESFDILDEHQKEIQIGIDFFSGLIEQLGYILKTEDLRQHHLTPYADVSSKMPPTFLSVGEHDFLKIETFAYAKKLVQAGVETKVVLYKGFGHGYLGGIGLFPQSQDCVTEMGQFILKQIDN